MQFYCLANFTVSQIFYPIGCRNTNAVHPWVLWYIFSQRRYTGITSPLRMHVKMRPIQRNARCGLSCARDLILTAYLPDICSVSCWSHGIVQCAISEAHIIHLIYELECIFSFLCQIFANWIFNYTLLVLLSHSFTISQIYSVTILLSQRFIVSQIYYLAVLLSCNFSVLQIYRLAVLLSCSFTIS